MPGKVWRIAPPPNHDADQALQDYAPVLRQVLFNRGHFSAPAARAFLSGRAPGGGDPFSLLGMQAAVDRLRHAVRHCQPIAIYGDYDTDGVTATVLLVQTLQALGADVVPYIPNRHEEGYGLNTEALDGLQARGVRVVVTVDCGVRSLDEVAHGQALGLDVIVTDHHQPTAELPAAFAVINPRQPGDGYPTTDLAGVGLAFKLAEALLATAEVSGEAPPLKPVELLDLVALGTIADMAPLTGENRGLVRAGLQVLNGARRTGARKLLEVARAPAGQVTAATVSFVLAPRLNAAGRLDSALAAYHLLSTSDASQATELALQLEAQNRERQAVTRQVTERARALATADGVDAPFLFAADPDFNPGVVGLAAARLMEEFYRPAAVVTLGRGAQHSRGSARSIPEFHITEALDACRELLVRHGGHAAAAGFTVETSRVGELSERLRQIAAEQLKDRELRPVVFVDAVVHLADLDWALLGMLEALEPCGHGNGQPIFAVRDAKIAQARAVGADSAHLKLALTDGRRTLDAIAFRQGQWLEHLPAHLDVAFRFEANEFNGERRLQLNVVDFKKAGEPD